VICGFLGVVCEDYSCMILTCTSQSVDSRTVCRVLAFSLDLIHPFAYRPAGDEHRTCYTGQTKVSFFDDTAHRKFPVLWNKLRYIISLVLWNRLEKFPLSKKQTTSIFLFSASIRIFFLYDMLEKLSYFLKETEEYICSLKSAGGTSLEGLLTRKQIVNLQEKYGVSRLGARYH
jgi:hypothetical protein